MKLKWVVVVASIAAVAWLGHNLLSYRKQGWGWTTLCVFAGAIEKFSNTKSSVAKFTDDSLNFRF